MLMKMIVTLLVLATSYASSNHHASVSYDSGSSGVIQLAIHEVQTEARRVKRWSWGYSNTGKRCLEHCLQAFAPTDNMCVARYNELAKHLPCFQASNSEAYATCNPKCHMDRLQSLLVEVVSGDSHAMGQVCRIAGCQAECEEPITRRLCPFDTEAGKFLLDLVRQSMRIRQRSKAKLGLKSMPDECSALARDHTKVTKSNDAPLHRNHQHHDTHRVRSAVELVRRRQLQNAGFENRWPMAVGSEVRGLSSSLLLLLTTLLL